MLEPLLQLRGEWRQAAAISVPSSAGEIAELLDKAIDVLDANSQLDEESLVMAADMICKAVPARADVIAILRMRLVRAAHDFSMVTAVEDASGRDAGGGSAFDSEEALAAALFAGAGGEDEEDDAVPAVARDLSRPRIDSKALQKSLSTRVPWWKRRWVTLGRTVVLLGIVAAGLFWASKNVDKLQLFQSNVVAVIPTAPPNTGTPGPTDNPNARTGIFGPHRATCMEGGTGSPAGDACSWPLDITSAGTIAVEVRWDDSAPLTVSLVDGAGNDAGPPVKNGGGVAGLSLPVGAGNYQLKVTNTSGTTDSIHFTAQIGAR